LRSGALVGKFGRTLLFSTRDHKAGLDRSEAQESLYRAHGVIKRKSPRYGNKELLTGSGKEFSFHVGPFKGPENVVQFKLDADTTGESAGIKGVEILGQDDAVNALEVIDEALVNIASARSTFGAAQSRFQYTIDSLAASEENMEAARSLIVDADIAHEVSELAKSQILQDMGVAVLSQANQDAGRAVRLIPG